MNFSFESIKPKSKNQNEDFYFDLETSRGHFFAVFDFAGHDYANLNATLKGKLETIVNSFVSLSKFSADLFLGFTAKEINNFLFTLGEQSFGPALPCSAALCLVSGNLVAYFVCGSVRVNVVNGGRLVPLDSSADAATQLPNLGTQKLESPPSDKVHRYTLREEDVFLVSTQGVEAALSGGFTEAVTSLRTTEAKSICEHLIEASAGAKADRTLLVVSGPYERYVEPVLADLSTSVTAIEARLSSIELMLKELPAPSPVAVDTQPGPQLEIITNELRGKASRIDLLEVEEKIKNLAGLITGKADTADVLSLQSEVLKLGIAAEDHQLNESSVQSSAADEVREIAPVVASKPDGSLFLRMALLALVVGVAGALIGGWLWSRSNRRPEERWSVKPAGNQILITRLDQQNQTIDLTPSAPPGDFGEHFFSSFADVKHFVDTITAPRAAATPAQLAEPEGVTEITIKPGDSLKKLAQQYNVPQEKIMELNPEVTRWPAVRIGQRVKVPGPAPSPSPLAAENQTAGSSAVPNTIEVTVVPGDSINRFAMRYKTTPDKIRELNPHITNWAAIQTGQKLLMPTPPAG